LGNHDRVNGLLSSIGEFVCDWLIYYFLSTAWHEWLHLWVLQALGGDGYIKRTWFGGVCIATQLPSHGLTLFYLAGGIGCGLTWLLLAWWSWVDEDWEDYSALMMNALPQIAYGVFEALCITWMSFTQYMYWATVVQLVALAVACLITMPRLVRYWLETV